MDAVVGEARFLADDGDRVLALGIALAKVLDEAMTHQTISDDDDSLGKEYTKIEIPADMKEQVKEYREKMIEGLAEDHPVRR